MRYNYYNTQRDHLISIVHVVFRRRLFLFNLLMLLILIPTLYPTSRYMGSSKAARNDDNYLYTLSADYYAPNTSRALGNKPKGYWTLDKTLDTRYDNRETINYFYGRIDNDLFWNITLTSGEMGKTNLFPVAYWKFDEGYSTSLQDIATKIVWNI